MAWSSRASWFCLLVLLLVSSSRAEATDILLGGHVSLGGTGMTDDVAEFSMDGPNFGLSTGVDAIVLFRGASGADIGLQFGWRYHHHSIDDEPPRVDYSFGLSLFSLGPLVRFELGELFTLGVGIDVLFGSLTLEYTVDDGSSRILNGVGPAVIGFQARLEGIFGFPLKGSSSVFYVGPVLSFKGLRHEEIDIFDPDPPFQSFFQTDRESTLAFTFSAVVGFTYEFQGSDSSVEDAE